MKNKENQGFGGVWDPKEGVFWSKTSQNGANDVTRRVLSDDYRVAVRRPEKGHERRKMLTRHWVRFTLEGSRQLTAHDDWRAAEVVEEFEKQRTREANEGTRSGKHEETSCDPEGDKGC